MEAKYEDSNSNSVVDAKISEIETLSRDHPMATFLREHKESLKGLSEEEFTQKYEAHAKEISDKSNSKGSSLSKSESKDVGYSSSVPSSEDRGGDSVLNGEKSSSNGLSRIVLKFTTLSEANTEAPSFTITEKGASVGRDSCNEVCVPSDARLSPEGHAMIENIDGDFYLVDGGFDCAASLRIGVGINSKKKWKIVDSSRFSAGNTIFHSEGINEEGNLMVNILDGPLKGESRIIKSDGATIGRSSDNSIAVPDRELSRRHSAIEYDEDTKSFYIGDVGSTNGTYMQLTGPYGGKYRLNINDHILVGRTGFSVNRFDYGISEEIGHRPTMEDSCAIVQHLNIDGLARIPDAVDFFPQSYFGVYDGHGGAEASAYLSRYLHSNIVEGFEEISPALGKLLHDVKTSSNAEVKQKATESANCLIVETIKRTFTDTDDNFIKTSDTPQHGSTATTALLLGNKLFCSNTGDSRTMLCRNFKPLPLTTDHKPSREDEANRIKSAGGFVIGNRVMGELAVSRAFGDADFKKGIQSIIEEEGAPPATSEMEGNQNWDQPLIIAEPDIVIETITKEDQFLLLACDGLFDVFTYDDVVAFVKDNMEKHGDAQRCCQNLTHEAIRKRNSRDNVSVILILLNKWY